MGLASWGTRLGSYTAQVCTKDFSDSSAFFFQIRSKILHQIHLNALIFIKFHSPRKKCSYYLSFP
jgi:hypothetical protein